MPNNIDIKIILPPNLKSLYLSDPEVLKTNQNTDYGLSDKGIINTNDNFFVGRVSLDSSLTDNKTRLVFGIRLKRRDILTDDNTEQYVDLKTIRSLTLSNSPDFSSDSNSTIEIKNWPYDISDTDPANKVTGSFKNYVYNLNPLSFYDSSIKFDSGAGFGRSIEQNGDDLFIINNWPLSGNGGISTIFIKIVARSIIDSTDIVYPGNATIFDQISWQSEPGIRPGLPIPVLTYATENHNLQPAKIFTGNKTLFRFSSANEQSSSIPGQINKDGISENSNIFGSGIARYVGDIVEVRGLSTSFTQYSMFSWLASTSNIFRTIAPNINATPSSIKKYNFDGSIFSNESIIQSNTSVTGTLSTSLRGVNFLLNTSFTNEYSYKPDIYAQANIKLEVDPRKTFDYKLLFKFNKSGLSSPQTASNEEIGIEVQLTNFVSTAKTIIQSPSTSIIVQNNSIAEIISRELIEGGQLEIYLSNLRVNDSSSKAIFKAYFTPNNRKEHSYLLANSTISNFSTLGWQTTSVSSNLTILQNTNNLTYTLNEFVSGNARILLDIDLGDCKYDDVQLDLNKVIHTTNWENQLSTSWITVQQNHDVNNVDTLAPISNKYYISSKEKFGSRSYSELQALSPTFSDRVKIEYSVSHLSGEYYVALYQKPVSTPNTAIASYLDEYNTYSSNVIDQPALLLKFSENDIKLLQRVSPTNELVVHDIAPYNLKPNTYTQRSLVLGMAKIINSFKVLRGASIIIEYIPDTTDSSPPDILIDKVKVNTLPRTATSFGYNQMTSAAISNFNNKYKIYHLESEKLTLLGAASEGKGFRLYFSSNKNQTNIEQIDNYKINYITAEKEQELIEKYGPTDYLNYLKFNLNILTIDYGKLTDTFEFVQRSAIANLVLLSDLQFEYDYVYNSDILSNDPNLITLFYTADLPNKFLGIYSSLSNSINLKAGAEINYNYSENISSGKVLLRNLTSTFEAMEIIVSNGPLTDENLNISIIRDSNQIAKFSSALRLPGPSNGLGWNFALGTRSIYSNRTDEQSEPIDGTIYNPLMINCNYATIVNLPGYVAGNNTQGQFVNTVDIIDGNKLNVGNTVLIKDQNDKFQNGVYKVTAENLTATSQLKVTSDFGTLYRGGIVNVNQGTYAGSSFFLYYEGNQSTFGDVNITWVNRNNITNIFAKFFTDSNLTETTISGIATGLSAPSMIEGKELIVGDTVLVKEQNNPRENGIYEVNYIKPPNQTKLILNTSWLEKTFASGNLPLNIGEYSIADFSSLAHKGKRLTTNDIRIYSTYQIEGTSQVYLFKNVYPILFVNFSENYETLKDATGYYILIFGRKQYLSKGNTRLKIKSGYIKNPFEVWNGESWIEEISDIPPTEVRSPTGQFLVGKALNNFDYITEWRNPQSNVVVEGYNVIDLNEFTSKSVTSNKSYKEVEYLSTNGFAIFPTPNLFSLATSFLDTDLFISTNEILTGTGTSLFPIDARQIQNYVGSTILIRNQTTPLVENGIYKIGQATSSDRVNLVNLNQPTLQSSQIITRIEQCRVFTSPIIYENRVPYIYYAWPRPDSNSQPTFANAAPYITPFGSISTSDLTTTNDSRFKNDALPKYNTMELPYDNTLNKVWFTDDILNITNTSAIFFNAFYQVTETDIWAVKGYLGDGLYTLEPTRGLLIPGQGNNGNTNSFFLRPIVSRELKTFIFNTGQAASEVQFLKPIYNLWAGGGPSQWYTPASYFGYMTSNAPNQTYGPGKLFFEKRIAWNTEVDNRSLSTENNLSSQYYIATNNINILTVTPQTVFYNKFGDTINPENPFAGFALIGQNNADEVGFYNYSNKLIKLEKYDLWEKNKSVWAKTTRRLPSGASEMYFYLLKERQAGGQLYDWVYRSSSTSQVDFYYTYKIDHISLLDDININATGAKIEGQELRTGDMVFLRAQTTAVENNKFYRVDESSTPLLVRKNNFALGTTMQPTRVDVTYGSPNRYELYFKNGFVVGTDPNYWIATSAQYVYASCKIAIPSDIGDVNTYNVPATLDGVSLSNNDRILLLNQNSNLKSNGIYRLEQFRAVTLTPALIVPPENKVRFDTRVKVLSGQRNANTYWGITFEPLNNFNYGSNDIFWISQKFDLLLSPCSVASTANINLNQAPNSIDGISLEVGFRILVKDQSTKSQNGIYLVTNVGTGNNGTWIRASDLSTSSSLVPHLIVNVLRGTLNKNKNYILYLGNPVNGVYTLNTTNLEWIYIFTSTSTAISTSLSATFDSRIILGNISVAGLPPKQLLGETDLSNQRHFMKAIGYSGYHKPFLGQALIAGNTDFWNFDYTTKSINLNEIIFAQQFIVRSRSVETSCFPQLLELKFEDNRYINNPNENLSNPSVKFYHFSNPIDPYASTEDIEKLSYIGTSLTNFWIEGNILSNIKTGLNTPNNILVQFDLKKYLLDKNASLELTNGQRYWLVIKVPKGMNLARTRGFEVASRILKKDYAGTTFVEGVGTGNNEGWQIVPYTWFKLFQGYRERYDNVFPQASLQIRVGGESHALVSTEYSGLSRAVEVDVDAPNSPSDFSILNFSNAADDTNRPVITEILQPSVRTALIKVKADDNQSGNWVFRIGKETDFGNVEYTDWLDWDTYRRRNSQNQPIQNEISYSIFLYGSTWLKPDGSGVDPYTNSSTYTAQNMGTDGPRKIWVDVMDKVGNKSQSYPVTLNGQLIALVDTVPPDADISLIAPDNVVVDYTNTDEIIVKVIANDTISSVKDMRFRIIDGAGTVAGWSEWYHYSEITRRKIESNIIALATPSPVIEDTKPGGTPIIGGIGTTNIGGIGTSNTGTATSPSVSTSTEQITWFIPPQSPISGLKRIEVQVRDYGNNSLQPMSMWSTLYKDSYLSRNSFVTLGSNPMAFANGVLQFPRNVFVNCSVVWQSSYESSACVYFGAVKYDNFYKNQSQDEITFSNIVWNVENEKAYELISTATGYYKRKIILNDSIDTITLSINGVSVPKFISVAQTPGTSYRVDSSFGYLIIKNIENIPSFNTPVFTCAINRSEAQIYKWDYNSIQRIANFGYAGERIILCMLALNKEIIFGTGTGNLWAFDGINFRGPLFTTTDLDGNKLPITCVTLHEFMHEANPFIYIGTGKKSFIFRSLYSDTNQVISNTASWERCKGESFYNKDYTLTSFTSAYNALFITSRNGKVFKYVRKLIRTNSTNEGQIAIELNLKRSEADPFESKVLPIRNSVAFANQIIVSISDRPEIHSYTEKLKQIPTIGSDRVTNIFEHRLSSIKAASTASLAWEYTGTDLVGTVDQNLTLDTITILNNDRVLIKNQADPIQNGIYIFRKSTGAQSRLTRAMDMEFNSKLKINTHVMCLSGATNGNKIFYLQNVLHKEYADIVIGTDSVNFSIVKTDTKYFFTRWTSYDFNKTFVQSPMSKGAFQFYLNNGESDSRNNTKYVYNKSIEDKNYENQYKEVTVLKGNLNESVLFETKTGSDWSYASGLPGPYTVDFEVRHVSGTGEQSFEVVGNNALVSVKFSNTGVTIQSGINKISKSFSKRSDAFTPYSIIPESYPQYGLVSIWNYSQGEDEDSNNFNPNVVSYGSLDNWRAVKFCTIRRSTEAYTQQNDNYLIVEPILTYFEKGDPIIGVESASNNNQPFFIADTHTYITVRLRFSISASSSSVRYVTRGNISTKSGLSVENYVLKAGDSILLRKQTNSEENGVYFVQNDNAASWTKLTTAIAALDIRDGVTYYKHTVDYTNANSASYWHTSIDIPNLNIKTFWDVTSFLPEESFRENQFVSTPISFSTDYLTYEIRPAWLGPVSSLYFEFENIKNITSGIIPKIHIDYVSVQTESGYYTITKEFTPIRLTMCGSTRRDVKLWVGKFEEPFIEVDNFVDISNVTLNPYIKFGKLIPEAGASEWAWANLKFHVGHVIPPVISDVQEFHPSFRFPSTGGAGEIVKHAGTIWCITDGIYIRKSTDNPNDHTFKTWKYIPEEELWRYQSPTAPLIRVAGKQARGNIKVFTAISYRNGLVAAGQVAEVGNPNPRPEES